MTDFVSLSHKFGNGHHAFKGTSQFFACFATGSVIRIAGNDKRSFSIRTEESGYQFTGLIRVVVSSPGRINMIPDMPKVIDIFTFAVPVADLTDFFFLSVFSDFPNSFMAKSQDWIRITDSYRIQVDLAIRKFGLS